MCENEYDNIMFIMGTSICQNCAAKAREEAKEQHGSMKEQISQAINKETDIYD